LISDIRPLYTSTALAARLCGKHCPSLCKWCVNDYTYLLVVCWW